MSTPVTVAIVEDNAEICEGLEHAINHAPGFTCVCACRNAETALRRLPKLQPEIVIMDIQLSGSSGILCTDKLKSLLPDTKIMMFTVYEDEEQIFKALEAGASGYLLKSASNEELIQALHQIHAGGAPMTHGVAQKVIQSFRKKPDPTPASEPLTPREEQVLQLLAEGHADKEIGSRLFISTGTVNNHLKHIYQKLHVRSRVEAVIKYLK
jgi:DNA-binding NarL/FixJ family response regulator